MLTLTPAYGRDYKTAAEVRADWFAHKDFIIATMTNPYAGKFINKGDADREKLTGVEIRYSKLTKTVIIRSENHE